MKQNIISLLIIFLVSGLVFYLSPAQSFAPVGIALPMQSVNHVVDPQQVRVGMGALAYQEPIAMISIEMKMHGAQQKMFNLVIDKAQALAAKSGCNLITIQNNNSFFIDSSMGNVVHFMGLCYYQPAS